MREKIVKEKKIEESRKVPRIFHRMLGNGHVSITYRTNNERWHTDEVNLRGSKNERKDY